MTPLEIRFNGWTLRTDSGELARDGATVTRLQDQALQVLVELLDRPGELVTREQLIARLWPRGVVDFETGLNTVVRKLRMALGDDANTPRYIETIPRKGYRFIGNLEPVAAPVPPSSVDPDPSAGPAVAPTPDGEAAAAAVPVVAQTEHAPPGRRQTLLMLIVGLVIVLAWIGHQRQAQEQPVARSLAVLPFKPLLQDFANPALELGMADTLITQLSEIPGLRVSPLTAVRPYDGQDPLAIGRALKVDAVLEGSLQTDRQQLRLSARLLRVSDGEALWAGEFSEPMTGIFELQDAFARKVVAVLALRLSPEQAERLTRPATSSTAAYQHYANGLYLWQQRSPQAAEEFEAALRTDPGYALAWSGLAQALAAQGVYGYSPPRDVFPRARQAALKAVELAPGSAAAHTALGQVLVQAERRYREGEQQYLEALRLDPDDATAWFRLGIVHANLGRLDEAVDDVKRARELEPLTLNHGVNLAMFLYLKRDYAAARAELVRILALDPGFDHARAMLGRTLLAEGNADAAIEEFRRRTRPVPGGEGDLGRAYARAGRTEEARAEIARLEERAVQGYGVAYDLAGIHAALGDTAQACAALRRSLDDQSQLLGFLSTDPALDPLRGEACYDDVLQRLRREQP